MRYLALCLLLSACGDPAYTDTYPECGDGVTEAPEQCDDGGETAACDLDCTKVICGDGLANWTAGEECDTDLPVCVKCKLVRGG